MKFGKHSVLAALGLLLVAGPVQAAEPTWPRVVYNRVPLEGDLVLPMPCGGAMVFRPVEVPGEKDAEGKEKNLSDQKVILGGGVETRAFVEHPYPAYISGSFLVNQRWTYYVAKYELLTYQYQSLMSECPTVGNAQFAEPQTNITPAEAMMAAEKYSSFLAEKYPDSLPKEGGASGFIRLPTEEEWEYAARGGLDGGEDEFSSPYPKTEKGPEGHFWYNATSSADGLVQPVGMKDPNSLGLHDMLGNAEELVYGVFRLNHVGRLHGRAGAFIKRGGSFESSFSEIYSGRREEFAVLGASGLRREERTGTRFVIAAPVMPPLNESDEVLSEWNALSVSGQTALGEEQSDPRKELQALSKYTETLDFPQKEEVKRRLDGLVHVMDANIAARNEERNRVAREMLRVAVFAAGRLPYALRNLETCRRLMASDAAMYKKHCDQVSADATFDSKYYLDHLARTRFEFPMAILRQQAGTLSADLNARDMSIAGGRVPRVLEDLEKIANSGDVVSESIIKGWANP